MSLETAVLSLAGQVASLTFRLEQLEAKPTKVSPEAQAVYAAYPLKVGKPAALRAIQKVLDSGVDASKLLATTNQYAEARKGFKEFTPHPATWYGQRRFEDDPSTWVPARAISPLAYQAAKREVARLREEHRVTSNTERAEDIAGLITQHNKTINDYERQN